VAWNAQEPGDVPLAKAKKSEAEILMWQHLNELKLDYPIEIFKEFRFHTVRKWRFDFAVFGLLGSHLQLAVEIDGGSWIQGRHNTGSGSEADREKFNFAAFAGYRVLKFTPKQVLKGKAVAFITECLESSKENGLPKSGLVFTERYTPGAKRT
jgi:very-short-patch-repair endonuclease